MAISRVAFRCGYNCFFSPIRSSRALFVLQQRQNHNQFYLKRGWNISHQNVLQRIDSLKLISNNPSTSFFSTGPRGPKKVVQFNLTDIGEGITEVNVIEWFVKVGDRVAQFDNICEVQSDKASVTITSRYDGIVTKIYYDVDDVARVGQPLIDVELEGELGSAKTSSDDGTKRDDDSSSSSDEEDGVVESRRDSTAGTPPYPVPKNRVLTTPAVRHMAARSEVNLLDVKGTGKWDRITKEDLILFIKARDAAKVQPVMSQQMQTPMSFTPKPLPPLTRSSELPKDRTESVTGIKKAMVKSMMAAILIPHFSFCDEVDLSGLVDMKSTFKDVAQKYGIKFTYTSIFVKAASVALAEFPILNSSFDSESNTITYKGSHNIGVAMDSPAGLIVPNIKNVAQLSILEVASELSRLNHLSAAGKLGPSDLTGGTFTLSNVGMIGGTYLKPVIFYPEVVIGALGSIKKLPRFDENDEVVAAHVMNVSWSADHRIVDGATMARFSNLWKSYLENPASLLLHLK